MPRHFWKIVLQIKLFQVWRGRTFLFQIGNLARAALTLSVKVGECFAVARS